LDRDRREIRYLSRWLDDLGLDHRARLFKNIFFDFARGSGYLPY
jgi:hypothetical protein